MRERLASFTSRGWSAIIAGCLVIGGSWLFGERGLMPIGLLLILLPALGIWRVDSAGWSLAVTRHLTPARVACGETVHVRLEVTAPRNAASTLLAEEQMDAALGGPRRFALDSLRAGVPRAMSYRVDAPARGRYTVGPLSVSIRDPFGLCQRTRASQATASLLVTPRIEPLSHVRYLGGWTGGGDGRSAAFSGMGDDDVVPREYRHGDDLRRVHWRASARAGSLMVRREEQPRRNSAALILDLREGAYPGKGPDGPFEKAVSWAASIGVHLLRSGTRLDMLDHRGGALLPMEQDADREGALLDVLSLVQTTRDRSFSAELPAGANGPLIAVVGRLSAEDAASLARLRPSGGGLLITFDGRDSGSAESHLARSGWRIFFSSPESSISDAWDALNARGQGVA